MNDPYLNELRKDFENCSYQIKKIKKLLKTDSKRIVKNHCGQRDPIAKGIEKNQKQSVKATRSILKERKAKKTAATSGFFADSLL